MQGVGVRGGGSTRSARARARGRGRRAAVLGLAFAVLGAVGAVAMAPRATSAPTSFTFSGSLSATGVSWMSKSFAVAAPGPLSVSVDWDDPAADVNVFLYDPTNALVATALSTTAKPESIVFNATQTGTWKIGVKARVGSASFTATVTVPGPSSAVTYSGRLDATGTFGNGRVFALPAAGGTMSVSVEWDNPAANLNVFVYDPSGAVAAYSTKPSAKPEVVNASITAAGSWRVYIKAVSGAATFTATVTLPGPPPTTTTSTSTSTSTTSTSTTTPPPPPGATDWPMWQRDARHTGVTPDAALGAANAPSITPIWERDTGAATYSSPIVATVPSINKKLVFVGNQSGTLSAYDTATGQRVWFAPAGATPIASSVAVANNTVYFGATNRFVYALDAATGAQKCSFRAGGVIYASPVVVDPDGNGPVVYIGDAGISGGNDGGSMWAIDATTCALRWKFDQWGSPAGSLTGTAGSWSPPAFARDANGRALVVIGGSSPDNAVYALDAVTGALVWRFQTQIFYADGDVGAGATVSPPGVNGFARGVVYVAAKNRIMYALDLQSGAEIWEYQMRADVFTNNPSRSTAALLGRTLYFGDGTGVYAVDAITGARVWKTTTTAPAIVEVTASPAVSGASGDEVVFVGDMNGVVYALRARDGTVLWSFTTGSFVYSSPTVSGNQMFVGSDDGMLYAFGIPNRPNAAPTVALTSPADGSAPANPNGSLTLGGTAQDDIGVTSVLAAVLDRNTGMWWNPGASRWQTVFAEFPATLAAPGAPTTSWTASFPVPFGGCACLAEAVALDGNGQRSPTVPRNRFAINALGNPPDTTMTWPSSYTVVQFPGARQSFPISIQGTATDTGGAQNGIASVHLTVMNVEHGEYFCGTPGCGGTSTDGPASWGPSLTQVNAVLASPGAGSTTWTLTFPTYDHPHKYRIQAWAQDLDGNVDATRATAAPLCVRDVGDNTCS